MRRQPLGFTESGNTIVVTLITLVVLAGFVGFAVDYTGNIARNGSRDRLFNIAVEIGDGCISEAFSSWRQICKTQSQSGVQNPSTSVFASIPTPTPGNFPSYPGAVITNYKVQAVDPLCTLTTTNPPVSSLDPSATPPQTTGPGTGTFSYFYLASADVTLPAVTGTLTAKVRRIFEKRYTSPWNWAMMYSNNLELHPASNFTLNGWVHTNQDAYVGNTTNYLTLTDRLTYQGNYTVGYHASDTAHSGSAATPTYPSDLPPGHEQYYALFGWDESQFNTSDSNPNNDGYREMIMRPNGSYSDPFSTQRLYNQAAIVVTIDASNTMKVYQGTVAGGRSDVTGQSNSGSGGTAAQAAAAS